MADMEFAGFCYHCGGMIEKSGVGHYASGEHLF